MEEDIEDKEKKVQIKCFFLCALPVLCFHRWKIMVDFQHGIVMSLLTMI